MEYDFNGLPSAKVIEIVKNAPEDDFEMIAKLLSCDSRKSVAAALSSKAKRIEALGAERERLGQLKMTEASIYSRGYKIIAGVDEVGRGPLFGPVVAAAVAMRPESWILYVNDSKKLSHAKRQAISQEILSEAISFGIGIVEHDIIDEINILNATKIAMVQAVKAMEIRAEYLISDSVWVDAGMPCLAVDQGDEKCYSVAAASIIAKVERDAMMLDYAELYPEYDLGQNKGYGTKAHIDAILRFGPTPHHRMSFLGNLKGMGQMI
ncbi:MAG: ribonuclease HII [Eubacteriaceae bacterium]|nr:ribonuclease HII [Eubacteriaceae bacterium]